MTKIIFADDDGEKVTLEGDFVQIGDLFQALKRMCLAMGLPSRQCSRIISRLRELGK